MSRPKVEAFVVEPSGFVDEMAHSDREEAERDG